jgi:hypothetical protein
MAMNRAFHDSLLTALLFSAGTIVPGCGGVSTQRGGSAGQSTAGASGTSTGAGGVHGGGTTNAGGSTNAGTDGSGAASNGAVGGTDSGSGGSDTGGTTSSSTGGARSTGGGNAGGTTSSATGGTQSTGGSASSSGGTTNSSEVGGGPAGGQGAIGGSSGTGGNAADNAGQAGSSDGGTASGNTLLVPNQWGWIDHADAYNDVGVQGSWYAYGDAYGNGSLGKPCLLVGEHQPSECAFISAPDPTAMTFPNVNGAMHTTGIAEEVLPCVAGSMAALIPTSGCPGDGMAGGYDYANMWGGGIAFDFNRDPGPPNGDGTRHTWNPAAYGVIGIRFTIQNAPASMRVEFPMTLTAVEAAEDTPPIATPSPTTDSHSAGAPYWGSHGDGKYVNSPVIEGQNTITWDSVRIPKPGVYVFDTARLLGIKFHVPTSSASASAYDFTISNLTFLREL